MKLIRFTFILLLCCFSFTIGAVDIARMEPSFWWVGMKNPEVQIMLHGSNISKADVRINYPGVVLKEIVRVENPNYLFLYIDIGKETVPGTMHIEFQGEEKTTRSFELMPRSTKTGAQGFSTNDVMYLIMPDRFANGDPSNDNLDTVKVNRRQPGARHGGDLRGIINKLDYLSDLGITTIWMNPVLENRMPGGSSHGYAITDFYNIDPRLGTNEEYCELVDKAHAKGMKIVMDMIFNHCGSHHPWLNDLPSSDWLNNKGWLNGTDSFVQTTHFKWTLMDIHAPETEKEQLVDGWFVRNMPDLNQRNKHLATYLIQNSIFWIEYSRIDGIRQDTHPYGDYDFMVRWCKEVEAEYPDFNIVGEAWYPRITASAWWQGNSKNNDRNTHLKTVMDFNTAFASDMAFTDVTSSREGSEAGLFNLYEIIAQDYLFYDPTNILVFLDNHDVRRFNRQDEPNLNRFKQAMAFLMTTRGIPQIYYGTEILMYGGRNRDDGGNRKDFPGGWMEDEINAFTPQGRTPMQNEAWNYLQKILQWRKTSTPVTQGKLIHYTPDNTGCYVYARIKDNKTVLILLNGTDREQTLDMYRFREVIGKHTKGRDVVSKQTIPIRKTLTIPLRGVYILELEE